MPGLSVRSSALAVGLVLAGTLVSPLGPMAYADDTVVAPVIDAPGSTVPATEVPLTSAPVTVPVNAPVAATPSVPKGFIVLRQGSRNLSVVRLEKRIGIVPANNLFDAKTRKKVQSIQRWGGIRATGVVDYRTAKVIVVWKNKMVAKTKAASNKQNAKFARIIAVARQYKGRPYRYGAKGPTAFDCSGYTSFVVRKALGRSLPSQSGAQKSRVKKVSRSQARAGDLIFFNSGGRVSHVGIYAGGNKLWHSSRPGTRTGLGTIFSSNVSFGRVVV